MLSAPPSTTSDQDLVAQARTDAQAPAWDTLLSRYQPLLWRLGAHYGWSAHGWSVDDILQILRIGLWQAVMRYDPSRSIPFAAWLRFIVHRRLADTFKHVLRQKHQPLNGALRLDAPCVDAPDSGLPATLYNHFADSRQSDPAEIITYDESVSDLLDDFAQHLSDTEWQVCWLVIQHVPYTHIAQQLHTTPKSIDNTMQRVRRKCRHLVKSRNRLPF